MFPGQECPGHADLLLRIAVFALRFGYARLILAGGERPERNLLPGRRPREPETRMLAILRRARPAAAVVAAAALVTACAGCSGSSGPSHAGGTSATSQPAGVGQRPAQAAPDGYKWAGSDTMLVWVAIPQTWVALNLAQVSVGQATRKFATTGIGYSTLRADLATLKEEGALFFADPGSSTTSAHGFTTNATALCQDGTGTSAGPSSIAGLETAMRAEYAQIKARVMAVTPTSVVGGRAFAARLALTASAGYGLTELQVVALSNTGRTCIITFSTDDPARFLPIFQRAAATIEVG
jgi:hypothetical protein